MRPRYLRDLTKQEQESLQEGLKSSSPFTVRRCQILLSSAAGKKAGEIGAVLHCSDQTVRNAIRAFEQEGLASLQEGSHARHDQQAEIDEQGLERLRTLVKVTPRAVGHKQSVWTRPLLAETLHQEGLTCYQVSPITVGRALQRAGIKWHRAKQWIRSPDQHYQRKKKA